MKESVNNMITDWLEKNNTPEQLKAMEDKINLEIEGINELKDAGYKFNTDKSYSLVLIRELGFNPIGISTLMCEETFIFETKEESLKAHQLCQIEKKVADGWWYGKEDFLIAKKEYEDDMGYEVIVYWL